METYSFTYSDEHDVMISLSFTIPTINTHIMSFHEMSQRAALAFGCTAQNINDTFGENFNDSMMEFEGMK